MKIIELEQGSPEWLAFRKDYIGASDAPVICGVSFYGKTPLQLYEEKKSLRKSYKSKAMERGTELEPIARRMVDKDHGTIYTPMVVQSEEVEFMIASLDGYDIHSNKFIEIKCPKEEIFESINQYNDIPLDWIYQMNHQMFVVELDEGTLIVYNGTYYKEFVIKRDNTLVSQIIEKERTFYKNMVDSIAPEGSLPVRTDLEAMESVLAAVKLRDAISKKKEEIKEMEEEYDIFKQGLAFVGGNESFECGGYRILKVISPGKVNYKKIPELKGVDLSPYRGDPIEYWRIT